MKMKIGLSVVIMLSVMLSVCSADVVKEDTNKKIVVDFYEKAINQKNFEAASKYLGPTYIQHNPHAFDGPEGLKGYLTYLKKTYPDSRSEIKSVYADGDHVILHVHSKLSPSTPSRAIVDIFRVKNGKVVEHWDVIQDVPEKAKNSNGMF